MKSLLSLLLFLFSFAALTAQSKHTISGYISDAVSGERLIGATIYDKDLGVGTTSNVYGFYSITLPNDSVTFLYSYVGYEPQKRLITLIENIEVDIAMSNTNTLGEVVITGEQAIQERTEMSTIALDMTIVESLPVLLGEKDILKTVQLLPGVQSGSEGSSGIYVRGGGPDQNLFLLDGVPLYNVSHLFGFFSVFNPDGISSVDLVKGGFPARYGGRLSSVLDIRMKEGNQNKLHGEGGIGIISSRLTLEGPITKGKTSFLVSGRRTYIDILAQPIIQANSEGGTGGYFFYDANGKINHTIDKNNRVYLSGYFGQDKASYKFEDESLSGTENTKARLAWGNAIVAARWNRIINPKLFANTTATFSNYRFVTGVEYTQDFDGFDQTDFYEYRSGIRDYGLKVDFDYHPDPHHLIKAGAGYTFHTFTPGASRVQENGTDNRFGAPKIDAHEPYVFIEDDWKINANFKVNIGVRASGFAVDNKFYSAVEPRLSARYLLSKRTSVKASYAKMTQYLHLLTNGSVGLPTDLWVPVTGQIKPQVSDQLAAGVASTIWDGYELTVEGYYKWMNNLIDYKDGASFQGSGEDWQTKVTAGKGWSYGGEIMLRKKVGDLTGWIGYTLSWSDRQFETINNGNKFPYKFDRRHDISVALKYQVAKNIDMGFVWVFGTGNAISLPIARYEGTVGTLGIEGLGFGFDRQDLEYIDSRNSYRMPSYHRFDFGVNFKKEKEKFTRTWSLGVYNAYNRQNPFFLYFSEDNNGQRGLYQASLFPIIPSIAYNFKF